MIKRGEIYYISNINQSIGSEQRAGRPAVIVSNNANNKHSNVYEVVYITTQPKTDLPTHFITNATSRTSTVLCEQINSVSRERIGEWIGTLTQEEIEMLDKCLAISVAIKTDGAEVESLQQQVEAALKAQRAAEHQAAIYKEMYEFLLNKELGARENDSDRNI